MTEKTNYEIAISGLEDAKSCRNSDSYTAYATAAHGYATLAVADAINTNTDELRQLRELLAEAFTPTNEEGKRTLEINANMRNE